MSIAPATPGRLTATQRANDAKFYLDIIKGLALARQKLKISQAELASRLGRPQSYVGKTESGARRLDVYEFAVYCKVLEVDPVLLLSRTLSKHKL